MAFIIVTLFSEAKRRAAEPANTTEPVTEQTSMEVDSSTSISQSTSTDAQHSSTASTVRADSNTESAESHVTEPGGGRFRIHRFTFGTPPLPREDRAQEEIDMRDGVAAENRFRGVFTSDESSSSSDDEPPPAAREDQEANERRPPRRWAVSCFLLPPF